MGLFEKQTIIFEGTNQFLYHEYQQIMRNNGIRFKAYATDKRLQYGCCGLNSGTVPKKACYSYSIFVKEKEARIAKELVSQFKATPDYADSVDLSSLA
ncbi:MAG: hypothetical protein SCM11_14570 [Bacillota bacterium]|nr:hypothetical protein [Bacillota bacterium]